MSSIEWVVKRLPAIGATAVALYAALLGVLLNPTAQRFALYANNFNTLFLDNLHDPRRFGFAKNQVTPFNISTPDGETLYAWHVLPADIYARHEEQLRVLDTADSPVPDIRSTLAFGLLTSDDPVPPRVVVSFHGNAGHIAQGWRAATQRQLAVLPNTHVLTIDYRGFGYSTGSPTEAGLITDGIALVDWVLNVAKIPPERIVIVGQSLGTAVASAVALHFALPHGSPDLVDPGQHLQRHHPKEPTTFAGVVLVAPFSNLPSLLLTYRIGGVVPILLPLRPFPALAKLLTAQVADKWYTANRLSQYSQALAESPRLIGPGGRRMGSLQVIHALNDMDISFHQTEMICQQISGHAGQCPNGTDGPALVEFDRRGTVYMRFQLVQFGGHNQVVTHSVVPSAVIRAFEDLHT